METTNDAAPSHPAKWEKQCSGDATTSQKDDPAEGGEEIIYSSILVRSIVVLSLMLATFLIALDMVSHISKCID